MRSPTTSCKLTACSEVTAPPLRRSQGCRGEPAAAITGCSCVDHTKRLASPAGLQRMEHADRIRKLILTAGKKLKKVTPSQGDGESSRRRYFFCAFQTAPFVPAARLRQVRKSQPNVR